MASRSRRQQHWELRNFWLELMISRGFAHKKTQEAFIPLGGWGFLGGPGGSALS